ncbi:orotidine-5'-phosphate decarboxylase [Candidatus Uhrbacteria bacterium]|nr:orotidine-5'-phosphate decarboxylase [Candidatus Uhrbacteria bacterium]
MLEAQWAKGNFVCVGLDSEFMKLPDAIGKENPLDAILAFNVAIVDATRDLACVYKPNIAFYEAYGDLGAKALRNTVSHINKIAPGVPIILDAKRGDIGSTNHGYARSAFGEVWGFHADAITVSPYLGGEALKPFLDNKEKGIIVLCRTSNPGAGEFQDLSVEPTYEDAMKWGLAMESPNRDPDACWVSNKLPLYQHVAYRVSREWNANRNCALVVGATYPEELEDVRKIVGGMPILIPGIGAQGGDLEATVAAGKDSRGRGMIINSSRGIIFASNGPDFADAARRETIKLRDAIRQCLARTEEVSHG